MGGRHDYTPVGELGRQKGWRWQQAFVEVRKGAAPADAVISDKSCPVLNHLGKAMRRETYRTLELGSLAAAALDNVV